MIKQFMLPLLISASMNTACSEGEYKSLGKRSDPPSLDGVEGTGDSGVTSEKALDVTLDEAVLSEEAKDVPSDENPVPPAALPPPVLPPPVVLPPGPKPTLRFVPAASLIRAGGSSFQLSTQLSTDNSPAAVRYTLEGPAGKALGTVSSTGLYTSPAAAGPQYDVTINSIWLKDETVRASSKITLVPEGQLFTACTASSLLFPIYSDVYTIAVGSQLIPNFAAIPDNKVTRVCMDSFNIPSGTAPPGFPGRSTLVEWFALLNRTVLVVPTAGFYRFRLGSDDGSRLAIDSQVVIDHDGNHVFSYMEGAMQLAAGEHPLTLRYFQGVVGIGLVLQWMPPGSTVFSVIPPSAFR